MAQQAIRAAASARRAVEPLPREAAFLHPGEVYVGSGERAVKTILGSCVAVCLWDPEREVGGMNHFLLPLRMRSGEASDRFGEVAMVSLLEGVLAAGGRRETLRAKIFGGASGLGRPAGSGGELGARNVEVARRLLEEWSVRVVDEDVGGRAGRRLVLRTGDGATWLRFL